MNDDVERVADMAKHRLEQPEFISEILPSPRQLNKLAEVAIKAMRYGSGWTRDYSEYGLSKVHSADIEAVSAEADTGFTMIRHHIGGQYRDGHKTGVYTYKLFDSFFVTNPDGLVRKTNANYLFEWTDDNTLTAKRVMDQQKANTHISGGEYEVENASMNIPTSASELTALWGAQESYQQVSSDDCKQLTTDLERYYKTLESLHS